MNYEDLNDYMPSILNPRSFKKRQEDLTLTQCSFADSSSFKFKKKSCLCRLKDIIKLILNYYHTETKNSVVTRCSLSLKRGRSFINKVLNCTLPSDKENIPNNSNKNINKTENATQASFRPMKTDPRVQDTNNVRAAGKETSRDLSNPSCEWRKKELNCVDEISLGFSAVEDIHTIQGDLPSSPLLSVPEVLSVKDSIQIKANNETLKAISSNTELKSSLFNSTISTINGEITEKPTISLNFGFFDCDIVDISTKNSHIKNMVITRKDKDLEVDCQVAESLNMSQQSPVEVIELSSDDDAPTPPKKLAVAVNLEIKKKTESQTENSKVLILNTNAIERLSHVIVQPPNYKLVKRQILDRKKFKNKDRRELGNVRHGTWVRCDSLKQRRIDSYFAKRTEIEAEKTEIVLDCTENVERGLEGRGDEDMSKNLGGLDGAKCERSGRTSYKSSRREVTSPKPHSQTSPRQTAKSSGADRVKLEPGRSPSPKKNVESIHFNLPSGKSSNKNQAVKNVPFYKYVAGTHFAVDAFSYGELPNVKHYFLTHFHSDHYSGLKKSFKKTVFCSQITADLCISRLGVNSKCIQVINFDDPIIVDGIEVTAIDANHCPGAMMLVFTLPNGKTLLHTGDFRASPAMESYPVFWNKDIHTIYLDSTYCNPRYDFPTQDQCLEMALYLLRQKKLALEKAGKKFSSVLIVCGTYTIGKEKFFMGVARRVGCSVWACPEKDKVLQAVEGKSFSVQPPAACQLHVVPMRDLTHEKLRSYLETLQGVFNEVVAFKPSGWENGKNSSVEKDQVTIHGIPYSEHSSFSEMIRFVKFLQPQQVCPTVEISGGIKAVQKYFPCPLVGKDSPHSQSKVTDYFSIQNRQHVPAVT